MSVTSESIDYLFKKGDVLIKQCNCAKCGQVIETYWLYVGRSGARKEFRRVGRAPHRTGRDRPLCQQCEPDPRTTGIVTNDCDPEVNTVRDKGGYRRGINVGSGDDPWGDHALRCREEGAM